MENYFKDDPTIIRNVYYTRDIFIIFHILFSTNHISISKTSSYNRTFHFFFHFRAIPSTLVRVVATERKYSNIQQAPYICSQSENTHQNKRFLFSYIFVMFNVPHWDQCSNTITYHNIEASYLHQGWFARDCWRSINMHRDGVLILLKCIIILLIRLSFTVSSKKFLLCMCCKYLVANWKKESSDNDCFFLGNHQIFLVRNGAWRKPVLD